MELLDKMLSTPFPSTFQEIHLNGVELCSLQTLIQLLDGYCEQLRVVSFRRIFYSANDDRCFHVFNVLQRMANLRRLRLRKLDTRIGRWFKPLQIYDSENGRGENGYRELN